MAEVDTDLISSCCLQDALKPFTELSESAMHLIQSFYHISDTAENFVV